MAAGVRDLPVYDIRRVGKETTGWSRADSTGAAVLVMDDHPQGTPGTGSTRLSSP